MDTAPRAEIAGWERTEAAAWSSSLLAVPDAVRETLGLSCEVRGTMAIFRARALPIWFFNRITGVGLDEPMERAELDAIVDAFAKAGAPHAVCVTSAAQPSALPGWLEARGFAHTTTLARLIRSVDHLPSVDVPVQIRAVGPGEAQLFAETALRGFGLPPALLDVFAALPGTNCWRTYVGFVKGEPAASGALFVHGKTGWLGFGATVDDFRGRGIHNAMLARRMVDAADLGCRWLQTETNLASGDEPTPSLDNIRGMGFRTVYERKNYVMTPAP